MEANTTTASRDMQLAWMDNQLEFGGLTPFDCVYGNLADKDGIAEHRTCFRQVYKYQAGLSLPPRQTSQVSQQMIATYIFYKKPVERSLIETLPTVLGILVPSNCVCRAHARRIVKLTLRASEI